MWFSECPMWRALMVLSDLVNAHLNWIKFESLICDLVSAIWRILSFYFIYLLFVKCLWRFLAPTSLPCWVWHAFFVYTPFNYRHIYAVWSEEKMRICPIKRFRSFVKFLSMIFACVSLSTSRIIEEVFSFLNTYAQQLLNCVGCLLRVINKAGKFWFFLEMQTMQQLCSFEADPITH